MFNIKYNIIALYQVILGLLSSVLMLRVFGVTAQADSYLIACSVVASLQLIQIMFVEQFMVFYNDLKVENRESAREFYNTAVTFSLLSGVFFYILFSLSITPLIKLFAFGLDGERFLLLKNILQILFVGTVMDAANVINQRLLNAEMRFSLPAILNSLQTLVTVLLLAYLLVTHTSSIELIAGARIAGTIITGLAGFYVVRRMGFRFRFRFRHPALKAFMKNSLAMRFGHNLHNFLFNPITSNILSSLPSGYASYFYYAQRLQQIVGNVVVGPSYAVYQSRISRLWSQKDFAEIKTNVRKYLPVVTLAFVCCSLLVYFLIPAALGLVASNHLAAKDTAYIQLVFLALSLWQLVVLVESPFVAVGVASKKSAIFIITNAIFIATYFIASFILAKPAGIYSIPFGATIGQIVNLVFYMSFCMTLLKVDRYARISNVLTGNRLFRKALQ